MQRIVNNKIVCRVAAMQREQAVADLKCEAVGEHVVTRLPQLEATPAEGK